MAGHRVVRVVVDLAAGDDRHPLVEQPGERADHARLGLAPLAEEDHVVAGEEGVLELREHGVLVAEDAGRTAARRRRCGRRRWRRISSLTGRDSQPELASCPMVAGRAHGSTLTRSPLATRRGRGHQHRSHRLASPPVELRAVEGRRRRRRPPPRRRSASTSTTDWLDVAVPGHWRRPPEAGTSDGPILYRRRFEQAAPDAGRRRWVTFNGIFYQADVWLDGAYLGDPEGYFFPHSFDITSLSRLGHDHVLAVEVTCPPERGVSGRRNITGLLQHSEAVDRDWNPGGLWRPVLVYDTGPGSSTGCGCCAAMPTKPAPTCASAPHRHRRRPDGARAHDRRRRRRGRDRARLAAGVNEIEWALDIDRPALWWPRALGDQPLTDDRRRRPRRRRAQRPPLAPAPACARSRSNDWICSVNGERLFLKGANMLPTRPGLGRRHRRRGARRRRAGGRGRARRPACAGPHRRRRPVPRRRRARACCCSRTSRCSGATAARSAARRCARPARRSTRSATTRRSCSGAPTTSRSPRPQVEGRRPASAGLRRFAAQQLPSWNRSVLDRWVKRAFEQADPTRPTVAHGGVLPRLPPLDGTDSHLWLGWHRGEIGDLADRARLLPRIGPLRQRVRRPVGAGLGRRRSSTPRRWPRLDWDDLGHHHGLEIDVMTTRFPPADHPTFDELAAGDTALPGPAAAPADRDAAAVEVPPGGGFSSPGWPTRPDDLGVGARPRAPAQAGVGRRRRGVPAADRRRRSAAGRARRRRRPARSTCTSSTISAAGIDDAAVSVTCTWRGGRRDCGVPGGRRGRRVQRIGRLELDRARRARRLPRSASPSPVATPTAAPVSRHPPRRQPHRLAEAVPGAAEHPAVLDLGLAVVGVHQGDDVDEINFGQAASHSPWFVHEPK